MFPKLQCSNAPVLNCSNVYVHVRVDVKYFSRNMNVCEHFCDVFHNQSSCLGHGPSAIVNGLLKSSKNTIRNEHEHGIRLFRWRIPDNNVILKLYLNDSSEYNTLRNGIPFYSPFRSEQITLSLMARL